MAPGAARDRGGARRGRSRAKGNRRADFSAQRPRGGASAARIEPHRSGSCRRRCRKGSCRSGDETTLAAEAAERRTQLAASRDRLEHARLRLATFETAARMRQARLAQLDGDAAGWRRRRDQAEAQLATLDARRKEIAAELAASEAAPQQFDARRALLDEEIEAARADHRAAAD